MRTGSRWKIVPVLMSAAVTVHAADAPPSVDDADAMMSRYKQAQIALFDALRSDPSPARQVLAGRLYVDDDDTPSALRPKSADVVARAAGLAPDDAFVQWLAADVGSYTSSKCGPTRWPEAEVANLVRLEPDNAGALQYAAALAHAKGDQAGVDDALARMASARRADDHLGDEIAAWAQAYIAHPVASPFDETSGESGKSDASPQSNALASALQRTGFRSSPAESALEESCKPAADSDRTWQRLGWCADAGVLLATRGNSFNLRELGLKMLAAAGATRDDVADLQRQLDWLKSNAASPMQNGAAFTDAPADRAADWNAAPSEIVATERRLARLGKPVETPAGWQGNRDDEGEAGATAAAYQSYIQKLFADMAASSNAREQALGIGAQTKLLPLVEAGMHAAADGPSVTPARQSATLATLAAAHPDDLLVQWIAATQAEHDVQAVALANLQRIDGGNATSWALALASPPSMATLERMAQTTRAEDHSAELYSAWLGTVRKHPLPAELTSQIASAAPGAIAPSSLAESSMAMAFTAAMSMDSPWFRIQAACAPGDLQTDDARKHACVKVGELMLRNSTSLAGAQLGAMILRRADALRGTDLERSRALAWWQQNAAILADGDAPSRYLDDYATTASEVEALRLAATRAGKAEPPADWKSPSEKQAEHMKTKDSARSQ